MKLFLYTIFSLFAISLNAQTTLDADGPGNTYELITSVLAPGDNPIEVPDCNHSAFGRHIDEVFDTTLNANVFRFFMHTSPDNDRCINTDRQRNEIKTYSQSPDNLLGVEDEVVEYKWKFKLSNGFQPSTSFTHLHQLKAVGGSESSMPIITLTARKATPNKMQLRYAETTSQTTLYQVDLDAFVDEWVEATELVTYGELGTGTYSIEIKKISDDTVIFSYANPNIRIWKTDADFIRPKWGIYRSLNVPSDLRDEEVLFANFSVEENPSLSVASNNLDTIVIQTNPIEDFLKIKNPKLTLNNVIVYDINGKTLLESNVKNQLDISIDISELHSGIYLIHLELDNHKVIKKIIKL